MFGAKSSEGSAWTYTIMNNPATIRIVPSEFTPYLFNSSHWPKYLIPLPWNIYIYSFFLSFTSVIFSQKISFLIQKNLFLNIDYDANTFVVKNYIIKTFANSDCVDIKNYKLVDGDIKRNGDFISGYISNKLHFRLKKIDVYKYMVIESTKYLRPGKMIFATNYSDKYMSVQNMKWLNGKKTGSWFFIDSRNNRKYILKYKLGQIIDSIPAVNRIW